ncbi:MAG: Mpo1-like protein [Gammaproteobacteria bacterium]
MSTTATQLLAAYSADHQHPFNRLVHSICVPLIAVSIFGLLWTIPVPGLTAADRTWLNPGSAALLGLTVYYLFLAPRLGLGMAIAALLIMPLLAYAATLPVPLWLGSVVVFVIGWIGQFVGHYVEGRRPSFFRDLRFLLIGPLWVLAKLYSALGIRS